MKPNSPQMDTPASRRKGVAVEERTVSDWKKGFLDKLSQAQSQWTRRFEETLESNVSPVFEEMKVFLADNGFHTSNPLRDQGRRSFKFELAENAYLLMIFRSLGVGEFEVRCETFVPGCDPVFRKSVVRVPDVNETWARGQFQSALDNFVDMLAGAQVPPAARKVQPAGPPAPADELVAV